MTSLQQRDAQSVLSAIDELLPRFRERAQETEDLRRLPDANVADLDEAGGRLAQIVDEEDAQVLVGYDWHGGYGHPDHVQVHRVVHRAASLVARPAK